MNVTPCVGVWIETDLSALSIRATESHPAWVCGLKLSNRQICLLNLVTPCVGVWIETSVIGICLPSVLVTPCVGVWIETQTRTKSPRFYDVTPCVGVWIETRHCQTMSERQGHTLRGCVD